MKITKNLKLRVKGRSVFLLFILTFNLLPVTRYSLPVTCLFAADENYPSILQEKMKIEKQYETRIVEIIEKIAGPNKAVVAVTVELRLAKQTVSASKSEGRAENSSPFSGSRPKSKVLPGFEEEISESQQQQQQNSGEGKATGTSQRIEQTVIPTVINSIKVTILLAQGVPADKETIIKDAITQSIGGDVGDRTKFDLIIKKAAFSSQSTAFWVPFLKPSALIPLVLGLIFLIIIIGPLQSVLRSFASAIGEGRKGGGEFTVLSKTESKGETSGNGAGGGSGVGVGAGGSGAASVTLEEAENKKKKNKEKPFEYINKENLKNLLYLIQEEPAEAIAVIVTYLDPELSASIIDAVSPEVQMQIALCLVNVRLTSEEDLSKLPDLTIQFIMGEVKMDQLAIALKGAGMDEVMKKVMANMSEGGRVL